MDDKGVKTIQEMGDQVKQLLAHLRLIALISAFVGCGIMAVIGGMANQHFKQAAAHQARVEQKMDQLVRIVDQKEMNFDSKAMAELLKRSIPQKKQPILPSNEAQHHELINRYFMEEDQ